MVPLPRFAGEDLTTLPALARTPLYGYMAST
jgi:hypothetical protein